MNCNDSGGHSLVTSMSAMGTRRVSGVPIAGVTRNLTNHSPNLVMRTGNNNIGTAPSVDVHNNNAPLFIVSNMIHDSISFHGLSPSSVRSVSVLGSTSTATICNSHTSGNVIRMIAGDNGTNEVDVSCSFGVSFSRPDG